MRWQSGWDRDRGNTTVGNGEDVVAYCRREGKEKSVMFEVLRDENFVIAMDSSKGLKSISEEKSKCLVLWLLSRFISLMSIS